MLRDYGKVVQIVVPFLIEGSLELEVQREIVDLGDRIQPIPQAAEVEHRLLAKLNGELDIVGREGLAVGPVDTLPDLQLIRGGILPFSTCSKPRLEHIRQWIIQEQRLIDKADRSCRVVSRHEWVPVRDWSPLLSTRVQGF